MITPAPARSGMPADALEVAAVSKSFGARRALQRVTFRLRPGEAVGYLGPNGAGKTTTLKIISGLVAPSEGSVRLFGLDPREERDRALRSIGVLLETPGLVPYLRGRDVLEHVARARGIPREERAARVQAAASSLGVVRELDRPVGSLSTGLARRLLLAAALVGEPRLLLLDEPTLGLDPVARADLREVLRRLNREGTTLLLSTHLLEDVEVVCNRVLFLRDGQLVGDEPVEAGGRDEDGPRRVCLRFASDVSDVPLSALIASGRAVERRGPREVVLEVRGGLRGQAQLVAETVRAGLPLAEVSPLASDLAARYLELVGREEEG